MQHKASDQLVDELRSELAAAREQQLATSAILGAISRSRANPANVFAQIAVSASRLCQAYDVTIHQVAGDRLEVAAHYGPVHSTSHPLVRGMLLARAVIERRTIHVPDMQTETDEYPEGSERARQIGFHTVLAVPLIHAHEAVGVITLRRPIVHPFTDGQIALLNTFADQAVIAVENTRLFEAGQTSKRDLQESLEYQTATSEVLSVISRSPTQLQPVLDAIARTSQHLCEADRSSVWRLVDRAFQVAATSDYSPAIADYMTREPVPADRSSLAGRCVLEKRTLHVHDRLNEPDLPPLPQSYATGARTLLCVPLLREGEPIGVVRLSRDKVAPFTERQIALVETFADQAVIAIENTRLFNETQAALARQTATADILAVISQSPTDVQPVFQAIAERARELCKAEIGATSRLEGDFVHLAGVRGPSLQSEQAMRAFFPIARHLAPANIREALARRAPYQIVDVHLEPGYPDVEAAERMGVRSILSVPLLHDGRAIGTIGVARGEPGQFADEVVEVLQTFARQAVIAIENTRLFEAEQASKRELQEALEYQTATSDVLGVISRSPNQLQPVFDAILSSAVNLCGAEMAAVFPYDGKLVYFGATYNWPKEATEYFSRIYPSPPSMELISGRTVLSASIVKLPDAAADPHYDRKSVMTGHWRRLLGVPIMRESRVFGALVVCWREPGETPQRQIELLQIFADQAVIAIENARLFEAEQASKRELQESLEYQMATSEVLSVISKSPNDLQPVLDSIVETAQRLCQAEYTLFAKREKDDLYHIKASVSADPGFVEWVRERPMAPGDGSMVGLVAGEKQTMHFPDCLADPRFTDHQRQQQSKARTMLGVPLLRGSDVIGVIFLARTVVQPFTNRQIALLQTFADQAVIAIENTRLFEAEQAGKRELTQSLEYQTAISEVLGVISRSPTDTRPVFESIAQSATKLCGAQHCNVFRFDGKLIHVAGTYLVPGMPPEAWQANMNQPPIAPGRGNAAARSIANGTVAEIPDIETDIDYVRRDVTRVSKVRSTMGVPMLKDGRSVGTIVVSRSEPGRFAERQIELLKTFADQAVIAIENARLFGEVEARTRELQDSLRYQTAAGEVLNVISRSPTEVQPVFDAIVRSAAELCAASRSNIQLYDGERLSVVATHNFSPEALAVFHQMYPMVPDRTQLSGRAILSRSVVHVADVLADPDYSQDLASAGNLRAILSVPMLRDGQPIGVITVSQSQPRPFSERQVELLKIFADQAVIAIQNARLFAEVQARTRQLQEALEQQTATAELLKVIGRSALDLNPVFETLIESAVKLCGAKRGFVARFDGEQMQFAAGYNVTPQLKQYFEEHPFSLDRHSNTGRAAVERRTIHNIDVQSDPEYTYGGAQIDPYRTTLAVPMTRGDDLLGVILIYRHEVLPFTDGQIALIESFADQAAIAIENTRLFKELQARNRDLTALGEVGRAVSSTLDLKLVLKTIVDRALELSETDGGSIFYFRQDLGRFELGETTGLDEEVVKTFRKLDIAAGQTGLGEAIASGMPLQVADISNRPSNALRDAAMEAGLRAALIVPLLSGGEPLGALVLQRRQPGEFTPAVVNLMRAFADQSAIALENAHLFNEIAQKSRELEIASQHKSQFVANMSHELRTPLAAILGYAELMQEGFYEPLGQRSLDALTRIRSNGKHLLGLINTVLDIAKIESGQFTLNMAEYAIESVVETVRSATESLAQNKKLSLKTDVAKSLPFGLGDEQRLTQVLLNLVGNAIKFTDTGEVRVSAAVANGAFIISVADTGPGIPPDQLTRVFEQFHQVDSSNTKAKGGTGLGLAISKQIVEMHGGRIWAESTLGKGSIFHMELPTRAEFRKAAP